MDELEERHELCEAEVQVYRQWMLDLASAKGVGVPDFVRNIAAEGDGGEGLTQEKKLEQLKAWLTAVNMMPLPGLGQAVGSTSSGTSTLPTRGMGKKPGGRRIGTRTGKEVVADTQMQDIGHDGRLHSA